ncbi:hypothetical protein ACFYOT_09365 [Saccharothrix saharensis]|uniref:hypothetical protein n=1 Tax=Saccharothrix saharensis TaxID=571190 RepID=UPI0036D090AA
MIRLLLAASALGLLAAGCGSAVEPEQPAQAATTGSTAPAVAGIPPKPDEATQAVYLSDLRAIDPAIVGDKDPSVMVDRGRNQCSSVKEFSSDHAKLVDLTNKRFTAPDAPNGFGMEKSERILAVVRKHICPTF